MEPQSSPAPEQRTIERPQPGTVEQRTALDVPAPTVDGRRLHGVIPYGVESRDLGGFREVIEPGALAGADLSSLIATREHDRSKLLGRHPTTLSAEDRSDGFAWSVELPQSPVGEDVRVAIERGDLRSTSWRMIVGRDRWQGDVRHVEQIAALHDVCVTAEPAYEGAHAEYRAAPHQNPNGQEANMPEAPPTPAESATIAVTGPTVPALEATPPEQRPAPENRAQPSAGGGGGLQVETRSAEPEQRSVEERVVEGLRGVRKGEARSLTTSSTANVTPPELSSFLFDKLRASSIALASGIRVIPTTREPITWPRLTADVDPTWVAETELIPAGDPVFADLTATPKKLAHRVEVSNETIDDSEPSIVDVLNAHLAVMLGLKLDRSIFEGNPSSDSDSIRGLKYVSGIQEISLGTNGAALTSYDPIVQAVGLLRAANVPGPYAVAANPRTLTALELLKDESGSQRQLSRPPDLPAIAVSSQLSAAETQGTASNASSVYVYAPGEVVLVRRQDATIELDRSRLFDKDMSELRSKLRADLLVPNPSAVVRVKGVIPAA